MKGETHGGSVWCRGGVELLALSGPLVVCLGLGQFVSLRSNAVDAVHSGCRPVGGALRQWKSRRLQSILARDLLSCWRCRYVGDATCGRTAGRFIVASGLRHAALFAGQLQKFSVNLMQAERSTENHTHLSLYASFIVLIRTFKNLLIIKAKEVMDFTRVI